MQLIILYIKESYISQLLCLIYKDCPQIFKVFSFVKPNLNRKLHRVLKNCNRIKTNTYEYLINLRTTWLVKLTTTYVVKGDEKKRKPDNEERNERRDKIYVMCL